MHSYGVKHGDLHRENILVTPNNRVMLLDFEGATFPVPPQSLAAELHAWQGMTSYKLQARHIMAVGFGNAFLPTVARCAAQTAGRQQGAWCSAYAALQCDC